VNRAQKEYYKRDYAIAKAEGKPFFPYAVYKDLVIATIAIALVITLAIWHRVEVGEPVDPTATDFVPRPEWYFFFLFELLKIFKGQNALMPLIMATFIVPNILMLLLIVTPFIDRGPERRPQKRPIAMFTALAVVVFLAYMTIKGGEAPGGKVATTLPLKGLESNADAQAGSQLFLAAGCTSCHMIAGVGATGPGPDLTKVGTVGTLPGGVTMPLTADTAKQFLSNPPAGMLPFKTFTQQQYQQMAVFLSGLGTEYTQ
jgi:quinol---cytochrome c reductase cytochrome c subunit, bacillus type